MTLEEETSKEEKRRRKGVVHHPTMGPRGKSPSLFNFALFSLVDGRN